MFSHIVTPAQGMQAPEECYHQVPLNSVIPWCFSYSTHLWQDNTSSIYFLIRFLLFTFPALLVARQTILLLYFPMLTQCTTKCGGYNCYNFRIPLCQHCKGKVVQWGSHYTGLLHTLLTLKHLKRHFPLLFQHITSIYTQLLC